MSEPRITIIDVARAASVHPSTVSRVLNGRAELSLLPETRQRVVATARRFGYRPSALAAYGAAPDAKLTDIENPGNSTEFSLPAFSICAAIDLDALK